MRYGRNQDTLNLNIFFIFYLYSDKKTEKIDLEKISLKNGPQVRKVVKNSKPNIYVTEGFDFVRGCFLISQAFC